jgi:mono/diheme cytochrome c family protein
MTTASKAFAAFAFGIVVAAAQAQEPSPAQLAQGEQVFDYWCATCHSAGNGMPGTAALQAKYNGNPPALLLERADLTVDLVEFFVRNGVSVMPHFRKTEITDADLDALAAYIVATAKR